MKLVSRPKDNPNLPGANIGKIDEALLFYQLPHPSSQTYLLSMEKVLLAMKKTLGRGNRMVFAAVAAVLLLAQTSGRAAIGTDPAEGPATEQAQTNQAGYAPGESLGWGQLAMALIVLAAGVIDARGSEGSRDEK